MKEQKQNLNSIPYPCQNLNLSRVVAQAVSKMRKVDVSAFSAMPMDQICEAIHLVAIQCGKALGIAKRVPLIGIFVNSDIASFFNKKDPRYGALRAWLMGNLSLASFLQRSKLRYIWCLSVKFC